MRRPISRAMTPTDYAAEWKWDGIRVQAANEGGQRRLYSRTGEDIAAAFPDVMAALNFDGVIDGELLIFRDGHAAPFGDLQQRLNRKTADAKLMAKFPAGIRAYDLLMDGDGRSARPALRRTAQAAGSLRRAAEQRPHRPVAAAAFRKLGRTGAAARPSAARAIREVAEGLMLKRWDSHL